MNANYYSDAAHDPRVLSVLAKNSDGTVELGYVKDGNPVLVVGKCPVSADPKTGHCVLIPAPKSDPKK